MPPAPPVAPNPNRTLLIVLALVGVAGACLVGSCLVVGLVGLAPDDAAPEAAEGPSTAPADPRGAPSRGGGHPWLCSATAMVQVCMGAFNCSDRTATGAGVGDTQAESTQMAMTACRGSVGALGGNGSCTVTCSQKK